MGSHPVALGHVNGRGPGVDQSAHLTVLIDVVGTEQPADELHVVVVVADIRQEEPIVTVYEPGKDRWSADF